MPGVGQTLLKYYLIASSGHPQVVIQKAALGREAEIRDKYIPGQ